MALLEGSGRKQEVEPACAALSHGDSSSFGVRGGRRQGREAAVGWASGRSWPAGPATGKWPR